MSPEQAQSILRCIAGVSLTMPTGVSTDAEGHDFPGLFAAAESRLSPSKLRKWRERILDRDEKCVLCDDTRNLEAHHCKPKSLFPELAYSEYNGVMLCYRCHRVIIHGSNTWDLSSWQRFMPLWHSMNLSHDIEDVFGDAPIAFGLAAQGHIKTIEKMLENKCSWEEIGKAIGWCPKTAEDHYTQYLVRISQDLVSKNPSGVTDL